MARKKKRHFYILSGPKEDPVKLAEFISLGAAEVWRSRYWTRQEWEDDGYWIGEGKASRRSGKTVHTYSPASPWDPRPDGVPKSIQTSATRVSKGLET